MTGPTLWRVLAALSVLPGAGALTSGCGGGPPPYVDGGTPRALDVLSGAQIGRHYGETARLQVRYRLGDPAMTPLGSAQVRFAIFGDPGGSTLSTDRATTDGSGVASVSLTAGSEEASFKVEASADGAPDAEIDVTVSKQDFVDLSVALAYDGPGTVQTFRALLYVGQPCRALVPKPVPDPAFRAFSVESGPAGTTGTIAFLSLLSRDYAVMGRAEDASGHLLAFGCADVGAGLLPPGTSATLPLPLDAVQASPLGSFELTSELPLAPEVVAPSVAPLSALAACAESPGQNLLDAIEPKLSSALATAIESHRGAVDAMGCRPPQLAGGAPSLDAQLELLLTASGSPGAQLDAIALDLDHLAKSAELVSLLTITAAGAADFTAEHTLERLTLSTATGQMTYDLDLAGLPIIDVRDLPLTLAGAQLTLGSHGFTLGLAPLFGRALGDLALTPRGITPPNARGLIGAIVAAASRSGKTGCAAVEDQVCASTGAAGCSGVIQPACTSALDALAAPIDAGFALAPGLDLVLSGHATAIDSDGDLIIDTLQPGTWTTSLTGGASAPFRGNRKP